MFWQLNSSHSGSLTLDEFINIYDAVRLRWRLKDPAEIWFASAWAPLKSACNATRALVKWKYFEHIICK